MYLFMGVSLLLIVLVACTVSTTGNVKLPGSQGCPSGTNACYSGGEGSLYECCEQFETCAPNSEYDGINTCCANAGGCNGNSVCCMDSNDPGRRVFIPTTDPQGCYAYAAGDIEGHPTDDDWIPCPTPST